MDPSRCRPAISVHQAHTPAEHALYTALWYLGEPPNPYAAYRDIAIGYDKLAALGGGSSKRNMQRLAEILRGKLAIDSAGSTLILPAITVGKHRPPSVQINFGRSAPGHKTSPQPLSVL
jgi:hypothetical protein